MGNAVVYRPAYDAEVEYLESTGTQWIDTGVYPDNTYTFDCKIAVTQDNYNCIYWGTRNSGDSMSENNQCYLNSNGVHPDTDYSAIHLYSTNTDVSSNWSSNITPSINTMYEFTGMTVVSTMNPMIYPITLFAFNMIGDINTEVGKCRIGYWKCYSNGQIVRDFIPVRIGQVGYLYDKVSKQLFANKGTGNFILGNDVSNAVIPQQRCIILFPRYDSQVEYLESDGNSFIDTGLNASSELGILAHIQNSQDKDGWAFGGNDSVGNKELSFAPKNELNQSLWRFDSYITQLNALNSALIYELSNIQNHNVLKIGESTYTATNSTFESQNNLSLFARGSSPLKGVRIYDFKIYQNSTLVRDFIPVRIGQVGYMYDKVSKRLFENKGSGNFILGSDTNDAVASQRSVGFERIYEEYEWLCGDGYASIYLGECSNSAEFEVNLVTPTNDYGFVFGYNGVLRTHRNYSYFACVTPESRTSTVPIPVNNLHVSIDYTTHSIYANESLIGYTNKYEDVAGNEQAYKQAYFFGGGIYPSFNSNGSLGKVKIDDNNFVPCKLLQSIPAILDGNGIARQAGECGMWDKVSNRFYGNVASSGTFTVKNPKCYEEYNWLEVEIPPNCYLCNLPINSENFSYSRKYTQIGNTAHLTASNNYAYFSGDLTGVGIWNGTQTINYRSMSINNLEIACTSDKLLINSIEFPKYGIPVTLSLYNASGSATTLCKQSKVIIDNAARYVPCKLTHGIPASMDANSIARPAGTCGMWDKVNDKFYGNVASSGTFTVSNN